MSSPADSRIDASLALASSALSTLLSSASHCDGALTARLEANRVSSVTRVTEAVDSILLTVQQRVPAFLEKARLHVCSADKDLELLGEGFESAAKVLLSFIHQSTVGGESTLEFTEDTFTAVNRILDALFGFVTIPTALTNASSSPLQPVAELFRTVARIDSTRSKVSHAQWLTRGKVGIVRITLLDSAGEAVHGVTPAEVSVTFGKDSPGWSVPSVLVEANVVKVKVMTATDCCGTAVMCVNIWLSAFTIPLKVSTEHTGTRGSSSFLSQQYEVMRIVLHLLCRRLHLQLQWKRRCQSVGAWGP